MDLLAGIAGILLLAVVYLEWTDLQNEIKKERTK